MLNESEERLMAIQKTMRALADPIRREILNMLKAGRMSAGDITEKFEVTGASVSRHLSVLKEADLIRDTREGKFIYYELNASVLEEIMLWISGLKGDSNNAEEKYNSNNHRVGHKLYPDDSRLNILEEAARSLSCSLGFRRRCRQLRRKGVFRLLDAVDNVCNFLALPFAYLQGFEQQKSARQGLWHDNMDNARYVAFRGGNILFRCYRQGT